MTDENSKAERIERYVTKKYITLWLFVSWSVFVTFALFGIYKAGWGSSNELFCLFIGTVIVPVFIYLFIFDKEFSISGDTHSASYRGKRR